MSIHSFNAAFDAFNLGSFDSIWAAAEHFDIFNPNPEGIGQPADNPTPDETDSLGPGSIGQRPIEDNNFETDSIGMGEPFDLFHDNINLVPDVENVDVEGGITAVPLNQLAANDITTILYRIDALRREIITLEEANLHTF